MPFLAVTACLVALVWGAIVLARGSLHLSIAIFLAVTVIFPAEFFAIDAAGLTWTLDRLWFVALMAQAGVGWYRGDLRLRRLTLTDVAISLFFVWLVLRTVTQPLGQLVPNQPPALMHLVNGYVIPFALYCVIRSSRIETKSLVPALWVVGLLGCYLSVTALFELLKLWGLVFPKFIADPTLGIHFGRARGPMLQSVRLGMVLLACWLPVLIYTVWLRPAQHGSWGVCFLGLPLASAAIFCTYTRSIWMGLALVMAMFVVLCMRGLPQRAAVFVGLCCVLIVGMVKGPDLVAFKREYSAAETRESTFMRAAFAYVSVQMIKDRPLAGFGFNQFQVYNLSYLSDRSTDIRLESIRGYVHHNSFLSLMVDLGIIGFALYGLVIASAIRMAWQVWKATGIPEWVRGLGFIALAICGVHLIQMAFHEVSFSTIENSFLYAAFGLAAAARTQFMGGGTSQRTPADAASGTEA
jgi:O-antigen ligase